MQISNIAAELNDFSNSLFNRQQQHVQAESNTSFPTISPIKIKPSSVKIVTQNSLNEQNDSNNLTNVHDIIEHFQQYNTRNSTNETSPNSQNKTNFAALAYRPNNTTSPIIFHNVCFSPLSFYLKF